MRQCVNLKLLIMALAVCLFVLPAAAQKNLSDEDIQKILIKKDRDDYLSTGHHCPCPYDIASGGSICGKRSAWSRKGSDRLCYKTDVTPAMIEQERNRIKNSK